MKKLLERCRLKNLKLNRDKINFKQKEVKYLGHVLSANGVKPDPDKVKAIQEMKAPKNVKNLQQFLGLVNYVGKFCKGLSDKTHMLRQLEKKNTEWMWTI